VSANTSLAVPANGHTAFLNGSERISERALNASTFSRLHGVLSLRKALKVSQSVFARILAHYAGGKVYTKACISNWERAERDPHNLPKGYWRTLAPSKRALAALHRLIIDLVAWATRGRFTGRVSGVRLWRVRLVAARAPALRSKR
jgi:DNA-binding transcriptional regulator YiaG